MKIVIVENPRPLTLEHYNDVANAPLSASLNSGYALAVARRAGWDVAHLDFTSGMLLNSSGCSKIDRSSPPVRQAPRRRSSATPHKEAFEDEGLMAVFQQPASSVDMAVRILEESADLILFHWVYAWGHEAVVRDLLERLRRDSAAPLGAFGIFPTLARRRLMQYAPSLDFILMGEFEETLAELLQEFATTGAVRPLAGAALRDHAVAARPLMDDLARLPLPDDVGNNRNYPSLNIAASRGCFGQCSFCFIRSYYGCSRRRVRPLASLEQELETRLARRHIRSIYFVDPTFIGHSATERNRAVEIAGMAQRLGLPFGFETRVDTIDGATMERLAAHGAESVFLGMESGCDSVLKRIGKRIDTEQIRRAVQVVRGSGVRLNIGFIMFEPDTCLAELEENYAFLEELELLDHHELTANLLYHNQIVLYGSPAWRRFEREKRLLPDERLPFEARYRFRDERVGLVCAAMGRLSAAYFEGMDALRGAAGMGECGGTGNAPQGFSPDAVNALLKDAFRSFCAAAKKLSRPRFATLEEGYRHSLLEMLLYKDTIGTDV